MSEKKYIRLLNIVFLFFIESLNLMAQDSQFSQYYAAPLHLSPSFAGSTNGGRVVGIYRMQWPFIKIYNTTSFSVDLNMPLISSGIGLMAYNELAGTSNLQRTSIAGCYTYNFPVTKKISVRAGVIGSYNRVGFNFKKLTFGDEIYYELPETQEVIPIQNKGYFDAGASVMGLMRIYWLGVTLDHLLTPDESLTGYSSDIPVKLRVFGGGKIDLNGRIGRDNEKSIAYSFLYRAQGKFDQFDLGCYYMKVPLIIGLWYRGLPGIKNNPENSINHDALIFLIGYRRKHYGITYSYDISVSRLYLSGGAHEISFQYLFWQDRQVKKRDKRVIVPCPRF